MEITNLAIAAAAPATSCDFEDPGLCGWVHHDDTDVEWRLQIGSTKTSRTGPEHDHTFGAAGNGKLDRNLLNAIVIILSSVQALIN